MKLREAEYVPQMKLREAEYVPQMKLREAEYVPQKLPHRLPERYNPPVSRAEPDPH